MIVPNLLLGACAAPAGDYPSLLPRPVETRGLSDPPPVEAVAAPAQDPALDAEIAGLVAARDKAVAEYNGAERAAGPKLTAGAGAAPGSDAWLDAQTALAALDTPRSDLLAILTDIEQLGVARAASGQPPYPALENVARQSQELLARITARIAERKKRFPL